MPQKYTFKYLLSLALEHRRTLIAANIIAVLAVVTSVPIPLLIPLLVDEVLLNQPGKVVEAFNSIFPADLQGPILYIVGILVLTIVLRIISVALGVWQTKKFVGVSKQVIYKVRSQLLSRLQSITMSEYETIGSGGVSSLFVTDLNTVDEFAGQTVSKVLVSVLSIIGVAVILFWMNWQLALFIMLMNPVVIYFTIAVGKHVKDLKKQENKAFEIFQQSLIETLDGIQQIRASNRENYYLSKVDRLAGKVRDHSAAFSWKSDAATRLSFVIFLVGFDIFRAVGFLMVLFADLTIGEMIAVFSYLWFMMTPVQDVLNIQYAYYAAKAALGRINELLYLPNEPKYKHELNPFKDQLGMDIHIEDIKFAYGDGPYVLNGVNLSIASGEKVALVGASGGGKSTLVQVLLGLYPPLFGDIKFNGVSVTRIGMEVVREHVACVLQHPALFNDTLRNNLTLGREASDEELWEVLKVAQIDDFVDEMPRKLDSIIGRDGVRLSGGQRQRIAIARMALTSPNVVILDEATSALDADTEARVHSSLQEFLKDRTTLIIAHRLSAVKQADRALVFEDGQITEDGTHEQLLDSSGLYAKLYGHQHSA
ncbi:MAG: ABC transporter ATP-binding protein [Pseudomonadota bacterium]